MKLGIHIRYPVSISVHFLLSSSDIGAILIPQITGAKMKSALIRGDISQGFTTTSIIQAANVLLEEALLNNGE